MRRSIFVYLLLVVVLGMIVAACAPAPTPAPPVVQTVVVPQTVVVQQTQTVKETVVVPQTVAAPTAAAQPAATAVTTSAGNFKLNPSVSGNIELWHFWGSQSRRGAIRRVVNICQAKLPNIKVTETFKPFGDIWTANVAAVAAGSGMPDVIVEDRPQLYQRALDKVDMSLQKYIDRDGVDKNAFFPFTWQQTLYNNESYGLPFETDVRVLYWDKNLFKQAGLDPEKAPVTWDDVWAMADKLDKKNPDGTYARIGFFPLFNVGPDILMYTDGGVWTDKNGNPVVNSKESIELFTWIKKWVDRYGGWDNLQKLQATFAAAPNDAFMSGKVAMLIDIQGYVSQITFWDPRIKLDDGKTNDRLEYGVTDMPYAPGKSKGTWSGGFALSIPRGAKNPDAAWEFIKCATSVDAEASWARDTYGLAPNIAANKDVALAADPRWQFFVSALQYSHVEPFVKGYSNWTEVIGGPLQESIWKGADIKTTLDTAQKKIDDTIAKAK